MKIKFLLSFLLISSTNFLSCSSENIETKISNTNMNTIQDKLLDKDGKPTQTLNQLLELFDVNHDGTLKNIVELTQKKFIRPAGKERWEMDEIKTDDSAKAMELLKELGCIDEIKPTKIIEKYKNPAENKIVGIDFIIFGATVGRITTRADYAIKTYKSLKKHFKNLGLKFRVRNLIFLGSERKRDAKIETDDIFTSLTNVPLRNGWKFNDKFPETENEMCKFVFNKAKFPKEFKESDNVIFVSAPMQKNPDGTLRRATTGDTMEEMKKELKTRNMDFIKSLFFSNNPYIGYQDAVARTYLPDLDFETVGPAASKNEKLAVNLDTVARWLYQENIRRNK